MKAEPLQVFVTIWGCSILICFLFLKALENKMNNTIVRGWGVENVEKDNL